MNRQELEKRREVILNILIAFENRGGFYKTKNDYIDEIEALFALEKLFPEWVSVTERLPEVDEKWGDSDYVLTRNGDSKADHAVCWYSSKVNKWQISHFTAGSDSIEVTHWMPLPQPPQI